jgi:ABC-type transport system involved in cytochrome c biogenesis permease subunit
MADAVIVYKSVEWWRTVHPVTTVVSTLDPAMYGPFLFCSVAFMLLFGVLLTARVALENRRGELDDLYLAIEDRR